MVKHLFIDSHVGRPKLQRDSSAHFHKYCREQDNYMVEQDVPRNERKAPTSLWACKLKPMKNDDSMRIQELHPALPWIISRALRAAIARFSTYRMLYILLTSTSDEQSIGPWGYHWQSICLTRPWANNLKLPYSSRSSTTCIIWHRAIFKLGVNHT